MPPFANTPSLHALIDRDTIANASNAADPSMAQVVCAWPVSGQYGFGTRTLYYVLVATCVLARRKEWLRNACLAAALLLPAVAAIHAIVLAAVHVDTAVDLDIYGAFQICSIGILAAPVTVYNSKTYFNDPGRNIIFIWTGLLLAGMLSLTVEFYRVYPRDCQYDDNGGWIDPSNPDGFPYMNANCSLTCEFSKQGPYSPIRRDPTNEPGVIPVPTRLTFGAVTLLAAASSIPPVLTLIFTWEKILEINWRRTFAQEETNMDEPIEGTNGATPGMITFINGAIRGFLSSIQIPIFSGIVVVLLVLGEINFWSPQLEFQTEPFSSIGQWANVVATVLVILGSLFYVQKEREVNGEEDASSNHSRCTSGNGTHNSTRKNGDQRSIRSTIREGSSPTWLDPAIDSRSIHGGMPQNIAHDEEGRESIEQVAATTNATYKTVPLAVPGGHRGRVATWLSRVGDYLETPSPDLYNNSFPESRKEFPAIPGEAGRVADFEGILDRYRISRQHDDERSVSPQPSRASFSSVHVPEGRLPNRGRSPSRPLQSPSRSNTMPVRQTERSPMGLARITTSPGVGLSTRPRRDTLEVPNQPRPAHIRPGTSTSSAPSPTVIISTGGSPKIVVSAEPEEEISPTASTRNGSLPRPH